MIPKTISASSILVSEGCMARWKVENFDRTPSVSNNAADVGTACHYALEHFVQGILDEKYDWFDKNAMSALYQMGYVDTFGSTDFDTDAYKDGLTLVLKWLKRHALGIEGKVLSMEKKDSFNVKTSAGPIRFNYIWDRCDKLDDTTIQVVDYKSIRAFLNPLDLKKKIQPRAYALAAQIQFPEAEKIWVVFDMLRHDQTIGVMFTKEENGATYRYLQRATERIIDTPEDNAPETINEECKWCIRKSSCQTLQAAVDGGTIFSLEGNDLVEKAFEVENRIKALGYLLEDINGALLKEAESEDKLEWETEMFTVNIGASSRRSANSAAISKIVGPELAAKYGTFGVGNVDQMIENENLDQEQIADIKRNVTKNFGQPKPKISAKGKV